ncbi:MAG: SPASM domain-containing protein [Bdellovibrionaceae bacterium]|nr:SPASM domain-containing protein [Pseudobdellovibrionaceae bacterium]
MLAPVKDLYQVHAGLDRLFPSTSFGIQTNLVYPLTQEKRDFLSATLLEDGLGTSWDHDIRFGSASAAQEATQRALWEKNVRTLIEEDGHTMTLMVSITKRLVQERDPAEVIEYAQRLGFSHILFERITSDGNAKLHQDVLPGNREQGLWLQRMFNSTLENKSYLKIGNMLLSELAEGFLKRQHTANRCRNCESSLLTINADGTIAGCPNTGPSQAWGHIGNSISENLRSAQRLRAISCERFERNPACYSCEAFQYCNSDCSKLPWDEDGDRCPAPKEIWTQMMTEKKFLAYEKLLLSDDRGRGLPHGI